MNHFISS